MAARIRLARHGTTNRPFYRIVVCDSQAKRDGRYIELLGTYDSLANPAVVSLNKERAKYWLGVGALPSDTVRSIFKRQLAD